MRVEYMSDFENRPAGSVILVASAGSDSISATMDCLRRQTIANRLEVVLAARPEQVEGLRSVNADCFFAVKVVPTDFTTSAIARTAAIRKASADIVLFVEDHSFPTRADWAERFIKAHSMGHAAVGPRMVNANPSSSTSWANIAIEYGQWLNIADAGEVDQLPGHNSSYKRDVLLRYGDDLSEMLEAEWVLHNALRASGETLWIDPDISTAHLNFSIFRSALNLHFLEGRMFAASRALSWGPLRRLTYALAFPLIFLVRFLRIANCILRNDQARPQILRTSPVLVIFLFLNSLGEGIGYAFGDGNQRSLLGKLEYDRWRFLREADQALAFDYT